MCPVVAALPCHQPDSTTLLCCTGTWVLPCLAGEGPAKPASVFPSLLTVYLPLLSPGFLRIAKSVYKVLDGCEPLFSLTALFFLNRNTKSTAGERE